jgi:DNA-binding NtrC family response regulator
MANIDGLAPEPAGRGPATILIVDDEAIVLRTAQASLQRAGFDVRTADSGEKAIGILRSHTGPEISLVLLDMSMPDMDGKEVMQQIVARGITEPVLICSGHSEAEMRHAFSALPVVGFAQKPFTSRQLADKVSSVLRRGDE